VCVLCGEPGESLLAAEGNCLAFLGLAAALCCYKRLLEFTMQDTHAVTGWTGI
jgi:hypothetical protein